MLVEGVQPKKLEAQQQQYSPCAPLSCVLKPKMLKEQQRQHSNHGPPGPVKQPGSMPISKTKWNAQLAQKEELW